MKNLTNWFNVNNIILDIAKNELVTVKLRHKKLEFDFTIKW